MDGIQVIPLPRNNNMGEVAIVKGMKKIFRNKMKEEQRDLHSSNCLWHAVLVSSCLSGCLSILAQKSGCYLLALIIYIFFFSSLILNLPDRWLSQWVYISFSSPQLHFTFVWYFQCHLTDLAEKPKNPHKSFWIRYLNTLLLTSSDTRFEKAQQFCMSKFLVYNKII